MKKKDCVMTCEVINHQPCLNFFLVRAEQSSWQDEQARQDRDLHEAMQKEAAEKVRKSLT